MAYDYQIERGKLFNDQGQRDFLKTRDHIRELLKPSGAVRLGEAMISMRGGGDSWFFIACFDRMVELGELIEIRYAECRGQDRIFVMA